MLKIDRSRKHCLVIRENRFWPALRLVILLAVCAVYYFVLVSGESTLPDSGPGYWLAMTFPLFLSPYLGAIWRGLKAHQEFCFDIATQTVSQDAQHLADFVDIDSVSLQTINAGCEELSLCLVLKNRPPLILYEDSARGDIFHLANELAERLHVKLVRGPESGR